MSLDKSFDRDDIDNWFVAEVLPLEQALTRFIKRHWHDSAEVADLRQEIYIRVYEAAHQNRPVPVKPFLYSIGRNLMIDRLRKRSVVSITSMADIELMDISDCEPNPEQHVAARQELRRLQVALDDLPPRCREVIILRRVYGYSQREVARKLGIKEETVENQVVKGIRMLADSVSDRRGTLLASVRRMMSRKD